MKNIELIRTLLNYNINAKMFVVVDNKKYDFAMSFDGPDGSTDESVESISFFVDEENTIGKEVKRKMPLSDRRLWERLVKGS